MDDNVAYEHFRYRVVSIHPLFSGVRPNKTAGVYVKRDWATNRTGNDFTTLKIRDLQMVRPSTGIGNGAVDAEGDRPALSQQPRQVTISTWNTGHGSW